MLIHFLIMWTCRRDPNVSYRELTPAEREIQRQVRRYTLRSLAVVSYLMLAASLGLCLWDYLST